MWITRSLSARNDTEGAAHAMPETETFGGAPPGYELGHLGGNAAIPLVTVRSAQFVGQIDSTGDAVADTESVETPVSWLKV